MTTALVPIGDMERMAQAFAKSGMFGTKTVEQALVLLLLAAAEGQHPAIAFRDFDVIQNKPAKKAEAMLRSFLAAGGKVEWHQYDDNGASATFSHPQGGTVKVDWDAARAKKAGLSGKDNYAKYARAMYRSRVISEGCRTVYPASTSGLYVPEEVRAMVREDKRAEKDMGAAEVIDSDGVIETTGQQASAPPGGETASIPTPPPAAPSTMRTRTDTLSMLCKGAAVNLLDMLAKASVTHADELSSEDYDELVIALNRRIAKLADRMPA